MNLPKIKLRFGVRFIGGARIIDEVIMGTLNPEYLN